MQPAEAISSDPRSQGSAPIAWALYLYAAAFLGCSAQWSLLFAILGPRPAGELFSLKVRQSVGGDPRSSLYLLAFPLLCALSAWLLRRCVRTAGTLGRQLLLGAGHLLLSYFLFALLWILEVALWSSDGAALVVSFLGGVVLLLPTLLFRLPYRLACEIPGGWILILAPLFAWAQVVLLRALVPHSRMRERSGLTPRGEAPR